MLGNKFLSLCFHFLPLNLSNHHFTTTSIIKNTRKMTSLASLLRVYLAVLGPPESNLFSSFPASSYSYPSLLTSGFGKVGKKDKQNNVGLLSSRCNAISKPRTEVSTDLLKNSLPQFKWQEIVEIEDEEGEARKVLEFNKVKDCIETIQAMLGSMDDGEISISAYDTAWVALVKDINGSGAPQFPSSLQWIIENQLCDGSWGDEVIFSAHDRLINTLACVVALKSWNIHPEMCEKGMSFIKANMCKLRDENIEHMPIGFEVAFPSLIEVARSLNLETVEDSPILQDIYAQRDIKMKRIPKDVMHIVPTTLLHSLEGMPGLDWEKLLKLQCSDGSFLFSPSSTAYALMQTKDEKSLQYIKKIVARFNGGVPNVYPVDMFEHIWVIDRLERLGISRYFQSEIEKCVDYIHRYWTEKGICWARNTKVHDVDDTSMGFRLLRLHGRDVSADVFQHFQKDGEFFCFVGQSTQAVTGMYNLQRASQVSLPGETILEEANEFSYKFLREKQASNQLIDKWIITKDLPSEVEYALDVPWYASLPRIEARYFIEQYGGEEDVWIGKTLYRMPYVNNNVYLELAKLDFNNCQTVHQHEWDNIQKWYRESNLREFGLNRKTLLKANFLAAASIFEPERSTERLAWTKTMMLAEAISYHFHNASSHAHRMAFAHEFISNSSNIVKNHKRHNSKRWSTSNRLLHVLLETLDSISLDALVTHGRDISQPLRHCWHTWLLSWQQHEDGTHQEGDAQLIVRTIALCAGLSALEEEVEYHYKHLMNLTNKVCYQLSLSQKSKVHKPYINGNANTNGSMNGAMIPSVDSNMKELAGCVLGSTSNDIDRRIKQTCLTVAKSFYYAAHCSPTTINIHIDKVLFEEVA